MPKIPQYTHQPAQLGRQAGPRDFGGGEGDAAMAQAVAQVGQVTEKMLDLQQTTKVNSAVAESAVALSQLESAELENGDYLGRAERYRDGAAEVRKKFSAGLLPSYMAEYEDRFDPSRARGEARVRKDAWTDTIKDAKASLDIAHRTLSVDAVQAVSDTDRDGVFLDYDAQLARAEQQGLINAEEMTKRHYAFRDSVMSGDVREIIRSNPKEAIGQLADPEGPFATAKPERLGIWMDRAYSAYEADLRKQAIDGDREWRRRERDDKRKGRAAQKLVISQIELDTPEGLEEAGRVLDENQDVMGAEDYLQLRRYIRSGGDIGEVKTHPGVYSELSRLTTMDIDDIRDEIGVEDLGVSGDEILEDAIWLQYIDRTITKSDADRLVAATRDHRFGAAESHLVMIGELAMKSARVPHPLLALEAAGMVQAFQEWKSDNPKASRVEAMAYVDDLKAGFKSFNLGTDDSDTTTPPDDKEATTKQIDALIERLENGTLSASELGEKLEELNEQEGVTK